MGSDDAIALLAIVLEGVDCAIVEAGGLRDEVDFGAVYVFD